MDNMSGGDTMTLRNEISAQKQHGIVYTPLWIADFIVAETFGEYALNNQKICDPACGDGVFLAAIVAKAINEIKDRRRLANFLRNNIYGFDINQNALDCCKKRLDEVLRANNIKIKINWQIECIDSTDKENIARYFDFFDIVIGNPPYIRIQHMGAKLRARIVSEWQLAASGSSDIYMAFFELGLLLLKTNGKLGYITPNGYAKTAAGRPLRKFLTTHCMLQTLVDFGEHQIFPTVSVYTLITIINKSSGFGGVYSPIYLHRYDGKKIVFHGQLSREQLSDERWDLCGAQEYKKVVQIKNRGLPLHVVADIYVGVQTLADDVFILEYLETDGEFLHAKTAGGDIVELEKNATLPILKASVMKNGKDAKRRIIVCPYHKNNLSNPLLIDETQLRQQYPKTFAYLLRNKKRLLMRDKGEMRAAGWYAFGRAINLQKTLGDKILTSGMNKSPAFMKCPSPKYTFYSGYGIKIKHNALTQEALLEQLNSKEMDFYIRHTSRDYQSGWKSYAKSYIRDFGIINVR